MQEHRRLPHTLQFKAEQIHSYCELGRPGEALHSTADLQCMWYQMLYASYVSSVNVALVCKGSMMMHASS